MNVNYIGTIIVIIIVIAGGWYLLTRTPGNVPATTPTTQTPATSTLTVPGTANPSSNVTVTLADQGFSPASVTVPTGATVTFVNQSSGGMWVASAMHPSHALYSGTTLSQHCPDTANTSFDTCKSVAAGNSFSFTFEKAGAWRYHNHVNPSQFGSVTVQ